MTPGVLLAGAVMKFEDPRLADEARTLGDALVTTPANFSGVTQPTARISDLAWIHSGRLHDTVATWVRAANQVWQLALYDYTPGGSTTPLFGLQGGAMQYTVYPVNGHYDWHVDWGHAGEYRHRKLSVSVNLSRLEEYGGGDLEFHYRGTSVPTRFDFGAVYIFPSFVPHRVRSVTRGVRRSLVAWLCGPPLV